MTSTLALAAHAASPAPRPFNANFYIVAATAIPILFLAIAVQGPAYEKLLRAVMAAEEKTLRDTTGKPLAVLRPSLTWVFGAGLAGAIPLYGAAGEVWAFATLADQQAGTSTQNFIGSAVTCLIIATAAGPILTAWRTLFIRRPAAVGHTTEPEPAPETDNTEPQG